MKVTLTPQPEFDFPADLDNITPDNLKGKKLEDIKNVSIYRGSEEIDLGQVFEVEVEETGNEEVEIIIDGDLQNGRRLGQDMSEGKIKVWGDVGMYAGAFMSDGEFEIQGDADSWAGQKMTGGNMVIKGDVKDFLGSTFRGDWEGMTGGTITVEGDAGDQVAEWMDGGKIKINGDVGIHTGFHMKSGTVFIQGDVEERVGGQMRGGKIVVMGSAEEMLPGFSYEEEVEDVDLDGEIVEGKFLKFKGDKAETGKGSLLLSKEENEELISS